MLALGVVDHADISHPAVGFRSLWTLLPHPRGIETHVRARFFSCVALPLPRLFFAKGHFRGQQLFESLTRSFGHAFHRRFADLESTQLLERHFARLRKAGLDAGNAHHLTGSGAEHPFV